MEKECVRDGRKLICIVVVYLFSLCIIKKYLLQENNESNHGIAREMCHLPTEKQTLECRGSGFCFGFRLGTCWKCNNYIHTHIHDRFF